MATKSTVRSVALMYSCYHHCRLKTLSHVSDVVTGKIAWNHLLLSLLANYQITSLRHVW